MKKTFLTVLIVVLVAIGFFVFQNSEETQPPQVEPVVEETTNRSPLVQNVEQGVATLLDVRTPEELIEDGKAEHSTHFELSRLESGELPDLEKGEKIYIYCKGGVRAGKAEEILEAAGFTDLTNVGGLNDWQTLGGTIIPPSENPEPETEQKEQNNR